MLSSLKAVVFDLDGLVLDSESGYVAAWQQAAAAMGHDLTAELCRSLSGLPGDAVNRRLLQACGERFDLAEFSRLSGQYWTEHVGQYGIPVKNGFFSVLQVITDFGLPFCLATNSRRGPALACLELADLRQIFPVIVTRDDVEQGKPAPDVFIEAARQLGVMAGECLVLEDSPTGVAAAVAAGMPCVYVPSLYPVDSRAATDAVATLDDLEQAAAFISACLNHSL